MIWGCIIDYCRYSLKWVDLLLRRSDPSLLDFGSRISQIDLTGRPDSGLSMLKLVFNHTSRLRVFNLQAPVSSLELIRSRFFQQPAPNLEFMKFCILFDAGRVLTDSLFAAYAPRLQNLQLRRFAIDFSSPVLTHLTEIYVQQISGLSAAPTILGWLNLLGGIPSLRWITIIHGISDATAHTSIPVIHLNNLEMLSIEGEFHETVTLINHLIMPLRCCLRLRCNNTQMGFDQRILWALLRAKMDSWEKETPNRRLDVVQREDSITVANNHNPACVWDTGAEAAYYKPIRLDPTLAMTLRSPNSREVLSLFLQLFGVFEQTFSTTTSLKLWIDYPGSDGTEVFLPLISSFPSFEKLSTLYLRHDSHSFLFPLLQRISSSGSILLPSLHTVIFINADFRPSSGSLDRVSAFLEWRRKQGFPIYHIDIIESQTDGEYVQSQLREIEVDMDDWTDSDTED